MLVELRYTSRGQYVRVHDATECAALGRGAVLVTCCLHAPSSHPLRERPLYWRWDRQLMERVCAHGVGHPDPDDVRVALGWDAGVHGCDGCCRSPVAGVAEVLGDVELLAEVERRAALDDGRRLELRAAAELLGVDLDDADEEVT